ncbi:choice-of-anchor A family protein [Pseudodesulfovibrio cashew]|uniref:Choice-of-anchor A family protein n=1 Tax=Pseudodesulfovibrio cashew TaxID=2678688 RepID=A0A6I6JCC1_9BACT|nr:choice-of-anchor A family protein [Pseudodesulfovibrio cashew]QGY38738.1 choice-of-anchor A family protein [Pseudodesulfovibrio cashew]
MRNTCRLLLVLVLAAILPGTASASMLGMAGSYNGFIFNDFTSYFSDTEGRLAAGGDVNLMSYGVGNKLPAGSSGDVLTVGGDLRAVGGQVYHGNARVGGHAYTAGFNVVGEQRNGAGMDIDFDAEETYLKALSASLADLPGNGNTTYTRWRAFELAGDSSDLVVFNLKGADLARASGFNVTGIGEDTTVIFNVSGRVGHMGGMQMFLNGLSNEILSYSDKFLFNFYEAKMLDISFFKAAGSILAPYADVTGQWGAVHGTLVASSYFGTTELEYNPFTGEIPEDPGTSVPEPGTLVLLGLGLAGLGITLKRRRA